MGAWQVSLAQRVVLLLQIPFRVQAQPGFQSQAQVQEFPSQAQVREFLPEQPVRVQVCGVLQAAQLAQGGHLCLLFDT